MNEQKKGIDIWLVNGGDFVNTVKISSKTNFNSI